MPFTRCAYPAALVLALSSVSPLAAQDGARFTVGADGVKSVSISPIRLTADRMRIDVTCEAPVDCRELTLEVKGEGQQGGTAGPDAGPSPRRASFTVNAGMLEGAARGWLEVSGDGTAGGSIAVAGPPDDGPEDSPGVRVNRDTTVSVAGNGTEKGEGIDVGELLTRDCRDSVRVTDPDALYDARNNLAYFAITPVGNVLARPADVIDENDVVIVTVVGDETVVPRLAVSRASTFRTPGQISFLGQGLSLENILKGEEEAPPLRCVERQFRISDFAAGKGEVKLELLDAEGKRAEVGRFDFGVHTLYSGAFSFGPIRTELRDPELGTVTRGGKEVVTVTEDGTARVLYVLSFTPFMWGRRELEEPGPWYTHINPTIGIVPAEVQRNAILGLSVDVLNSFYLQGGVHAGRVRRLDPRSGLHLGDEFTGTGDVPIVREWDADWFVGLTVDLRAAVEFLRIAATGAAGGG